MGKERQSCFDGGAEGLVGRTLGRTYRITAILDEGGMGLIYAAEHLRLHREVAVKVLIRQARDEHTLQRFYREAALISRLQHPHIVNVLDFDTTETGEPYLVMERLHGETLEQRMAALGEGASLSLDAAVAVATEVASALTAAHQADIIHRDLKPANIFLARVEGHSEVAKLLDFGIGKQLARAPGQRKLTGEFDLLGTPDYMAPEQALGENHRVDQRTDQYALAAITFEMVTGRKPFVGEKLADLLRAIVYDDVPSVARVGRRGLPAALDDVFARGLARQPDDRFATASDFAAALVEVAGLAAAISSRPTDPAPPLDDGKQSAPPSGGGSAGWFSRTNSQIRRRETLPAVDDAPISQNDPRALIELTERAKRALDEGDAEAARKLADNSLALIEEGNDPALRSMLALTASLFVQIFEAALGGPDATLRVTRSPSSTDELSPPQAFLLSRIDDGMSVVDLLSLSIADRLDTLRSLSRLVDQGLVRMAAPRGSRSSGS